MSSRHKELSTEVLKKIFTTIKGKHAPKSPYKGRDIHGLLDEVTDRLKKENYETYIELETKLKGKYKKSIFDIIGYITDGMRDNKVHGEKPLEQLLIIFFAVFHPKTLLSMEDPIEDYNEIYHKNPESDKLLRYLFYYWSHEKDEIDIGLLNLITGEARREDNQEEWVSGTLRYFIRQENSDNLWSEEGEFRKIAVSKKVKNLDTISLLTGLPGDESFTVTKDLPFLNSLRVLVEKKTVAERKIMMCSYTSAISDGSKPTSGIGIIVRIGDTTDSRCPLLTIETSANYCGITNKKDGHTIDHRIPDEITNILFDRRDSLRDIINGREAHSERKLFDSFQQLPNARNVKAIRDISGLYFGYHLQNDFGKTGAETEEKGALRTIVLEVLPNGICHLMDDEYKYVSDVKPYFGFLSMKDADNGKILINIDREHNEYIQYHSWRLQFYMNLKPDNVLEGVVSGFARRGNNPITSPVRFKRTNDFKTLKEFKQTPKENSYLRTIFPITFFKTDYWERNEHVDLVNLLKWDSKAIGYFASINNNIYFNSPYQSLPQNFININFDRYIRFEGLKGNYYMVSFSNTKDMSSLSKVKVQLRNFGEAVVIYAIDHIADRFDIFLGQWVVREGGQILNINLRFRKRAATKLKDVDTDEPRNTGDFVCRLNSEEKIDKIDYLKCASLWVDYSDNFTVVAKRSFLFPASPTEPDAAFPDNFIQHYKSKFSVDKLVSVDKPDAEEFFRGIIYFSTQDENVNEERRKVFLERMQSAADNLIVVNKSGKF